MESGLQNLVEKCPEQYKSLETCIENSGNKTQECKTYFKELGKCVRLSNYLP